MVRRFAARHWFEWIGCWLRLFLDAVQQDFRTARAEGRQVFLRYQKWQWKYGDRILRKRGGGGGGGEEAAINVRSHGEKSPGPYFLAAQDNSKGTSWINYCTRSVLLKCSRNLPTVRPTDRTAGHPQAPEETAIFFWLSGIENAIENGQI